MADLLIRPKSVSAAKLSIEIFYECLLTPHKNRNIFKFFTETFLADQQNQIRGLESAKKKEKARRSQALFARLRVIQQLIGLKKEEDIFAEESRSQIRNSDTNKVKSLITLLSMQLTQSYKQEFWQLLDTLWRFSSVHWLLGFDLLLENNDELSESELISLLKAEYQKFKRIQR